MARQIFGAGPIQRIAKIAGQFKGMIQELEAAVDEAAAEKANSRKRVEERLQQFEAYKATEVARQNEYQSAIYQAENLLRGLSELLGG